MYYFYFHGTSKVFKSFTYKASPSWIKTIKKTLNEDSNEFGEKCVLSDAIKGYYIGQSKTTIYSFPEVLEHLYENKCNEKDQALKRFTKTKNLSSSFRCS